MMIVCQNYIQIGTLVWADTNNFRDRIMIQCVNLERPKKEMNPFLKTKNYHIFGIQNCMQTESDFSFSSPHCLSLLISPRTHPFYSIPRQVTRSFSSSFKACLALREKIVSFTLVCDVDPSMLTVEKEIWLDRRRTEQKDRKAVFDRSLGQWSRGMLQVGPAQSLVFEMDLRKIERINGKQIIKVHWKPEPETQASPMRCRIRPQFVRTRPLLGKVGSRLRSNLECLSFF